MRTVLESPLAGDTRRNRLYALWCCRYLQKHGYDPIASHLIKTFFLDDSVPKERNEGICSAWFWRPGVPHHLGWSDGMIGARAKCDTLGIPRTSFKLEKCAPKMWEAFLSG